MVALLYRITSVYGCMSDSFSAAASRMGTGDSSGDSEKTGEAKVIIENSERKQRFIRDTMERRCCIMIKCKIIPHRSQNSQRVDFLVSRLCVDSDSRRASGIPTILTMLTVVARQGHRTFRVSTIVFYSLPTNLYEYLCHYHNAFGFATMLQSRGTRQKTRCNRRAYGNGVSYYIVYI